MAQVLAGLAGVPSLVIVCLLLFAEEAGVPIPLAPGEIVLIGGGLIIASGLLPFWVILPAEYVAVLTGCLVGFTWARAVGPERLRALAGRLRAGAPFERAATRLRGVGVAGIGVSRLIPGLRIYTTLVAGGVGISRRRFTAGVAPAIAIWVVAFSALGVFVGIPAERLLGRLLSLGLRVGVVLAILALAYLGLRRIPPGPGHELEHRIATGARLAALLAIDLGLVALVVGVVALLAGREVLDPEGVGLAVFVVGAVALVYLVVARRSVGSTLGERLVRARYP